MFCAEREKNFTPIPKIFPFRKKKRNDKIKEATFRVVFLLHKIANLKFTSLILRVIINL